MEQDIKQQLAQALSKYSNVPVTAVTKQLIVDDINAVFAKIENPSSLKTILIQVGNDCYVNLPSGKVVPYEEPERDPTSIELEMLARISSRIKTEADKILA